MSTERIIFWLVEIAVVWSVLFAVQAPLGKRTRPVLRIAVFVLKLLLIPFCALLVAALETSLPYTHCDLLCAVYAALMGDVAASIIGYVVQRRRTSRGKSGSSAESSARDSSALKLRAALSFVLCFALVAYGIGNARHVVMKEHGYSADGLVASHTFAFAADFHVGAAQDFGVLEDFCNQVNAAAPEFVILGGDVTDELTSYEDMREAYRILSGIEAPTYFIYGNHDRQLKWSIVGERTYSDEQLVSAICDANITILADDYVRIAPDLVILGREDISAPDARVPYAQLRNPYEGQGALLVADHQPYDNEQLLAQDSALQVSGHTHAGQLFPLQAIYRILGLQAYGEFAYPGTTLYVSAGESIWGYPLRTEEHCEWDLITLHS